MLSGFDADAAPMIYTFGYGGRRFPVFADRVLQMDALVVDIRISSYSSMIEWSGFRLQEALGERYFHCMWWGNAGRQDGTGAMRLMDWEAGYRQFQQLLLYEKPLILMCGCRAEAGCHRGLVARLLRENGHTVKEMEWGN